MGEEERKTYNAMELVEHRDNIVLRAVVAVVVEALMEVVFFGFGNVDVASSLCCPLSGVARL